MDVELADLVGLRVIDLIRVFVSSSSFRLLHLFSASFTSPASARGPAWRTASTTAASVLMYVLIATWRLSSALGSNLRLEVLSFVHSLLNSLELVVQAALLLKGLWLGALELLERQVVSIEDGFEVDFDFELQI